MVLLERGRGRAKYWKRFGQGVVVGGCGQGCGQVVAVGVVKVEVKGCG